MIIGIYFKTSYVKNKQIKPADDYMGHDYFKTSYVKNKPRDTIIYISINKHFKTSYVKNKLGKEIRFKRFQVFQNILC